MTKEEKNTPSRVFTRKDGHTTPILRRKTKEAGKANDFISRMGRYGYEGLDKLEAHWKPDSDEYHAGPESGCLRCSKKPSDKASTTSDKMNSEKQPAVSVTKNVTQSPSDPQKEKAKVNPSKNLIKKEILQKADDIQEKSEHVVDQKTAMQEAEKIVSKKSSKKEENRK